LKHLLQLTDRLPVSVTSFETARKRPNFSGDAERPGALRKVILAVDKVHPTGPDAEVTPEAITDPQHVGDIVGALGTLKRGAGNSGSWRRKARNAEANVSPTLALTLT